MAGLPKIKAEEVKIDDDTEVGKIHDDLAVSESEDEGGDNLNSSGQIQEEDDGGELWF